MSSRTVQLTPLQVGRTYGQLLDHFEKRFGECGPDFRAKAMEVLREVVLDMASRYDWRWLHGDGTIVTTVGLSQYPLQPDVAFLDEGLMSISNLGPVTARPLSQLRRFDSGESYNGQPSYFAQTSATSVLFYPTPDAAYTILYDYSRSFADTFQEQDRPPMPPQFDFALLSGVEERLRADDGEFDPATGWVGRRYERMIDQLIFREASGKNVQAIPDVLPPSSEQWHGGWYW